MCNDLVYRFYIQMSRHVSGIGRAQCLIALILFALPLMMTRPVIAAPTQVCTTSELSNAIANAKSGSEIVMCNKTWNDVAISIKATGTASAPVRITAQTPGQVVLTGSSRLSMSGSYVEVDGLKFSGTYSGGDVDVIEFRASGSVCNNCRLTNVTIIGYSPSNESTRNEWIKLYGQNNRIDHNYFSGKSNQGPIISVKRDGTKPDYHRIDHNYFSRPALSSSNYGETVKIGQDDSLSNSYTVVENNYLYKVDGEIEAISVKASGNTIRRNTLDSSIGTITLRQGNANLVEGNYVLGRNRSGTGGIRIYGEDHIIVNNYIMDVNPNGDAKGGIVIGGGDSTYTNNGHGAVRNVLIAFNTIVNSGRSLVHGTTSGPVSPANVKYMGNIVMSNDGPLIDEHMSLGSSTFESNILYGANLGTSTKSGILIQNPALEADASGVYRPQLGSPAIDAANSIADVTLDMDGLPRSGIFDIGADEQSGGSLGFIGKCAVGPVSYDPSGVCGVTALPSEPTGLSLQVNSP